MQNLSSCLKKQQNSTCIRATGMKIKTIDILPTSKCNCTLLTLSFNQISDLSNIKQFNLLTTLHLESNCIERISELEPLSHLPQLKTLSLSGNKVCCLPLFKAHIINLCPRLRFLDGKNVSSFFKGKYSKEKFNQFISQEKKCFKSIYINDFIAQTLKSKKKNQKLTQDNLFSFFKLQNYQNTIHDLRLRSTNLSPSSYFNFLKQTMIALFHFIYKTSTLLELDKNLLLQYSGIIQSIEQENHFNLFLDKSQQLDSIALRLLNLTENSFDENTFNEFQPLNHPIPNQKMKIINRSNKKISNSSDSISSQFCNSEENHNKTSKQNKFELLSSKNKGLILNDDNDSASLSNDSNSHKKNTKKSLEKAKENIQNTNLINNQNNLSSDFEFLSNPLKTSSSKNILINNKSKKNHSKVNSEQIHEEEPASEETLPKCQQSVSSELSNVNHNEDANKSNLFLTELASEEIVSKSQQSFSEVNSANLNNQINKIDKELKNTSTEIEADEMSLENEKKNNNTDLHIHFLINQSNSPELASDEITQNTQSDSINQNKLNIHFPTSQIELASDEANQDSEVHTDSSKAMHSLSIEVASSSSSNKDEIFDQLSEGNENPNFKKNDNKKVKAVQISTSLELASDETLPHSSIVHQQTSESDLQQNGNSKKINNNNENDHPHHLKLPQSASLEFASDETLSNAQKSSSAFEDSESEGLMKSKKNQIRNKIVVNRNIRDSTKKSDDFIIEEEELASEEGQNEDHAVLFDKKVKKIRLDTLKEKHLKASQESFSLDEMASGETLPSANPHSSDDDSEFESENKKMFTFQFLPRNIQNNIKIEKEKNNHNHNDIISEDSDNNADFEDNALDSSIENSSDFEKEKATKSKNINTKVIPKVSPLFTYFKIWKMNYNFRIKRREMFKVRIMANYNLAEKANQNKEMKKKQ